MRVYIVAADVQDRGAYGPYTTITGTKYGEYVSIMGVYGSRVQAEHRVDELDREGFDVFPIDEFIVDANCWKYIGGYEE